MKLRRQKREERRVGAVEYKKQQSYHYSAQRSQADRVYGRKEVDEREDTIQKTRRGWRSLPTLFAFLLILVGLGYILILSSSVSVIAENGSQFIGDKQLLQQKADNYLKASITNRFKPTFDEQKLANDLKQAFPQYTGINVKTFIFRQKPVVSVSFAKPTVLLSTGDKLYILGEDGTVLVDITNQKPTIDTSNLPLLQDQTGVDLEVGKPALTAEQVAYIKDVAYQAEKNNLKVNTMTLTAGGGELDVRYGNVTYFVKYNLYEDSRKSSGTFFATKEELDKRGEVPSEYIDVRVPERAYVK